MLCTIRLECNTKINVMIVHFGYDYLFIPTTMTDLLYKQFFQELKVFLIISCQLYNYMDCLKLIYI
jgi:hypothetical protein